MTYQTAFVDDAGTRWIVDYKVGSHGGGSLDEFLDREQERYRQQLERNEKFIRATFGRYLSDEIVTELLERPEGLKLGGDLREVTIMMSDIRGFTTLSEHLAPAQVVKMLK